MGERKIYGRLRATGGVVGDIVADAGSISASELATDSVETAKIKALAVTTAKIAAGAVTASELATDAVETAKIKALAVTGAKLAANTITMNKLEVDILQYVDVQITNAQLLAIRATPITLVAAPGADLAIFVHDVYIVLDASAGAYTETTDNLAVEYSGGTDILTIETTGLVDNAAVNTVRVSPAVGLSTAIVANEAVQLFNSGDGEFGGGNAANTTSVRVWYSVVPTVAFT